MPQGNAFTGEKRAQSVALLANVIGAESARTLLREFHSLTEICRQSPASLERCAGLTAEKAHLLKASFALAVALENDRLAPSCYLNHTKDTPKLFREHFRRLKTEELHVLLLAADNLLLRDVTITPGSVTEAGISPWKVFHPAMEFGAASIILVHNHPSGDPTPSDCDIEFTMRIKKAGELLDIHLLDHVIIGVPTRGRKKDYTSFLDLDLL